MLLAFDRLIDIPVMSLQTGGQLARTKQPLINPDNLMIVAYELEGPSLDTTPSFLRVADVRELSNLGMIVDSSEEFIGIDDVIKIREIYDLNFELIGKPVIDQKKHKLGKVIGYAVEPGSFLIKQLAVRRPLLKSFTDTELLIDRTQIMEISDSVIVIKNDERQPAPVKRAQEAFTNPFRGQSTRPTESIESDS